MQGRVEKGRHDVADLRLVLDYPGLRQYSQCSYFLTPGCDNAVAPRLVSNAIYQTVESSRKRLEA